MSDLIFIILSIMTILGAVGMVYFYQPINSALSFILSIIAMSGLFALLGSTFLFMVQIIVYAGAVITLLLFIIMFLNVEEKHIPIERHKNLYLGLGFILLIPFNIMIYKALESLPEEEMIKDVDIGSAKLIGQALFENWVLAFELISILLLVALIGAVALAKRRSHD